MTSDNNNEKTAMATASAVVASPGVTVTKAPASAPVPLYTRMALSAVAGLGAITICHPLDVIRVQMQVSKYKNTLDAGVSIYRQAGLVQGLYAGISASWARQLVYGSCKMGIYSYLLEQKKNSNISKGKSASDISFAAKLGMGSLSGAIAAVVGTPTEVALVRMAADSRLPPEQRGNYTSVINCLRRITAEEGVAKLWRGTLPTVGRATLLSATQLGITSEAKARLSKSGYFGENGQWLNGYPVLLCSTTLSAFCATVASNPFDVVKSRMQNMRVAPDGTVMYTSMVDCFAKSIRAEGPMVMMAGFTPAFVKLAPYTVIALVAADKLTKLVTGKDAL